MRSHPPLSASLLLALCIGLAKPAGSQSITLALDEGDPVSDGSVILLTPRESLTLSCRIDAPGGNPGPLQEEGASLLQETTQRLVWNASQGRLQSLSHGRVRWFPPLTSGLAAVTVASSGSGDSESAELKFLVGTSFERDGDGTLGETVIGVYPNEHGSTAPAVVGRNSSAYAPPNVLYRIDSETATLPLVGDWTLNRLNPPVFTDESVRHVAMDERIPDFAGAVSRQVTDALQTEENSLRVLRGFVSPNERARLERMGIQLAEFTRFQYGDCLALIIDANRDYRMDDLNNDGSIDVGDAQMLADIVDDVMVRNRWRGGIGICSSFEGPNHIGTPYVQADLRGWKVTWRE